VNPLPGTPTAISGTSPICQEHHPVIILLLQQILLYLIGQ
jgi:hypothetical protein